MNATTNATTNATVTQVIPAGTEVVILRNGNHQWYATKQPVPVPDTVRHTVCPIRSLDCLTINHMGFQIWFMAHDVQVEISAAMQQAAKNMQLMFLQYDIPTRVMEAGTVPHPSTYLWGFGAVRMTESCWLIPKNNLPHVQLTNLRRAGANWHTTRISVEEAVQKLQQAIYALRTERQKAINSAAECRVRAQERLDNGTGDVNTRLRKHRYDLTRIEKTLNDRIEGIRAGCRAMGIPPELIERVANNAVTPIAQMQQARDYKASENVAGIVEKAREMGETAVADAVAKNQMPADIAVDYLEERGADTFSLRGLGEDDGSE